VRPEGGGKPPAGPGVTRTLRWVKGRPGTSICSTPAGVLPPRLDDQRSALLLALCDDIGQGGL